MTLALAIIGVVLAAASLAWQVFSHLSGRPRVRVQTGSSILPSMPSPHDWYVHVTAINRGGAATTISSWGFLVPDGGKIHQLDPLSWSATTPFRLESHSSVDFHMPVAGLVATCRERGVKVADLRSWVRLSSGQTVTGPAPKVKGVD